MAPSSRPQIPVNLPILTLFLGIRDAIRVPYALHIGQTAANLTESPRFRPSQSAGECIAERSARGTLAVAGTSGPPRPLTRLRRPSRAASRAAGRGAPGSPPCPQAQRQACGPSRVSSVTPGRRLGRRRGARARSPGGAPPAARAPPRGSAGRPRRGRRRCGRARRCAALVQPQPEPLGQVRREAQAPVERVVDLEEGADARALRREAVAKSAQQRRLLAGKTPRAVASAATRARS